jgi:hypothetical protein
MTTPSPAPGERRLVAKLDVLHDAYAEAINYAIAAGDDARVADLAAAYDEEAIRMVADHEGKTHLLPLVRRTAVPPRRRTWRRGPADRASA